MFHTTLIHRFLLLDVLGECKGCLLCTLVTIDLQDMHYVFRCLHTFFCLVTQTSNVSFMEKNKVKHEMFCGVLMDRLANF